MTINYEIGKVMSSDKKSDDGFEIVQLFTELVEAQNPQRQSDINFLLYSTWSVAGALKAANIPITQETASIFW